MLLVLLSPCMAVFCRHTELSTQEANLSSALGAPVLWGRPQASPSASAEWEPCRVSEAYAATDEHPASYGSPRAGGTFSSFIPRKGRPVPDATMQRESGSGLAAHGHV